MDRVKTLLQATGGGAAAGVRPTAVALGLHLWRSEGPLALFRGLAAPLLAAAPQNALLFMSYSGALSALDSAGFKAPSLPAGEDTPPPAGGGPLPAVSAAGMWRHLAAGTFSGLLATTLLTPSELAKVVMQVDTGRRTRYASSLHCLAARVRSRGLGVGAYQGLHAMLWRECIGFQLYFGLYQYCRAALVPAWEPNAARAAAMVHAVDISGDPSWALLTAGGVAGALSWGVIFPIDVLKTVVQASERPLSLREAADAVIAQRGPRGLFSGLTVCLVRGFIVNAVTFWGYERTAQAMAGAF